MPQLDSLPIDQHVFQQSAEKFGTPHYLYSEERLKSAALEAIRAPNAFGLSVRFAMKACPNRSILRLFDSLGLLFDASSGFEAERALKAGIAPEKIQLTTQELPVNLKELVNVGVRFNACSLHQLNVYGSLFPNTETSFRVNPGMGAGEHNRVNTGGNASSFGIWHEELSKVYEIARRHRLAITGLHSHVGAGTKPETWARCADLTLETAARMPELRWVSLGGGFKVARMSNEVSVNLHSVMEIIKDKLETFASTHGKSLPLEIEPGTFLTANSGFVVSRVIDIVHTGRDGYSFLKIDSGMTDILRPSLYGAQHPVWVLSENEEKEFLVVGHCCESGDIITPAPADPEGLLPRRLPHCKIGDVLVIGGAGAYCAGMAAKNYNSFPESPEVLFQLNGELKLIRSRQTVEQMLANECL